MNQNRELMSETAFARHIGMAPETLKKRNAAGQIPCAFVDEDSGRRYYSDTEYQSFLRRKGELAAEQLADDSG